MPRFTNPSLDKLRDAVDIVDLINGYTDLRRAGSQFTGLCPFHEERSPSFSVNPVEKLCFTVRLPHDNFQFEIISFTLDHRDEIVVCGAAVDLGFPAPEPTQVGAIDHVHRRH